MDVSHLRHWLIENLPCICVLSLYVLVFFWPVPVFPRNGLSQAKSIVTAEIDPSSDSPNDYSVLSVTA